MELNLEIVKPISVSDAETSQNILAVFKDAGVLGKPSQRVALSGCRCIGFLLLLPHTFPSLHVFPPVTALLKNGACEKIRFFLEVTLQKVAQPCMECSGNHYGTKSPTSTPTTHSLFLLSSVQENEICYRICFTPLIKLLSHYLNSF